MKTGAKVGIGLGLMATAAGLWVALTRAARAAPPPVPIAVPTESQLLSATTLTQLSALYELVVAAYYSKQIDRATYDRLYNAYLTRWNQLQAPPPPPPTPIVKTASVMIDGQTYRVDFTVFQLGGQIEAVVTYPSGIQVSYGSNWAGFTPDQVLANAVATGDLTGMAVALAAGAVPPPPPPLPPPNTMPVELASQLSAILSVVERVWVLRNGIWLVWDKTLPADLNTLTTGIRPGEQVGIKVSMDVSLTVLGQTFFSVSGWIDILAWPG